MKSSAQEALQAETIKSLGFRNIRANGEEFNNAAIANQRGDVFSGVGVLDIEKDNQAQNQIDQNTMFAEGSIGKIRYAGLAYMMQQAEIFGDKGLQQNARAFFARKEVGDFLEQKYPGKNLQAAILNLFTNGSEKATLADLTTHRSGIGDTTRDVLEMVKARGIEYNFTLPDLILPQPESVVKRDANGKPMAQKDSRVNTKDLTPAVYGNHEYSNLGYQLLGAAMEAAYFLKTGVQKDYQQLTKDFLLHPIEGRAKQRGLSFDRTCFPKDLHGDENVVLAKLVENKDGVEKVTVANQFNGANAAGGMFSSAGDSVKFFSEYFRGFPGTKEFGQDVNKFFSPETIKDMYGEALKFPTYANQPVIEEAKTKLEQWQQRNPEAQEKADDKKPVMPKLEIQLPGVAATLDKDGVPENYAKSGGTSGFISRLDFNAPKKEVSISMINQENLTAKKEKAAQQDLSSDKKVNADQSDSWVKRLNVQPSSSGQSHAQQAQAAATAVATKDSSRLH